MRGQRFTEYPRGPVKIDTMAVDRLVANQAKLMFDETAGSFVVGNIPENAVLEAAIVSITEAFDGTLALGNASDADAYIVDGDFPKTVGMHDPIILNIPLAAATAVKLAVGTGTTGAGTIWILWRLLK